jgi:hypothetical protein
VNLYAKVGTLAARNVWALRLRKPPETGQRFKIRELTQGAKPEPVLCREVKDIGNGVKLYYLERF